MGFEVNISNGNCAIAQEAKLPLHVQLLEEEDAVAARVHGGSAGKRTRRSSLQETSGLPQARPQVSQH